MNALASGSGPLVGWSGLPVSFWVAFVNGLGALIGRIAYRFAARVRSRQSGRECGSPHSAASRDGSDQTLLNDRDHQSAVSAEHPARSHQGLGENLAAEDALPALCAAAPEYVHLEFLEVEQRDQVVQ